MNKTYIISLLVSYFLITGCSTKRNLEQDLLLYLPLNGSVNDVSKLNNNTYSYNLAPEKDKNNNENGAFSFGEEGYIGVTDVNNFNNMESFSLSSWVYVNQHKEHNTIFSKCNPMRDFNLQLDSYGHVNTHFAYPDYTHIYSKNTVPLKTWTHIAMVYQNQVFKIYINEKKSKQIVLYQVNR